MKKIVFNARYGGFSISKKCAEWMATHGCEHAKLMLKRYYEDDKCVRFWYGEYDGPRHNPILVSAVETLGLGSGGNDSQNIGSPEWQEPQLQVHEIKGDKYMIENYDGLETVVEPSEISWIEAV